MTDKIKTDQAGGVLRITLNRPDVLNSFDEEMGNAFCEELIRAENAAVRCVVINGVGKGFCAGEDLRALSGDYAKGAPPDLGDILRRRYIPAIETILRLKKPVIAALNGVAAGAGVSLALACDYRVMVDSASLVLAFVNAALIPDAGCTWLLPKYVGVGRALDLAMTGAKVDSQRAFELGLVNEVLDQGEFDAGVQKRAESFASGPTIAYGLMKELIWKAAGGYLEKHLEAEAAAQSEAGSSADHLEGVRSFLEKRPARFEGN
jgi:2-(1,2-epoxy-1,2-dihydrophenyl)acetyl-CoA isomerase